QLGRVRPRQVLPVDLAHIRFDRRREASSMLPTGRWSSPRSGPTMLTPAANSSNNGTAMPAEKG
ncbi:hypothetical protein, partial [Streptomyces sp. Isolate_45]|uniref:hypothetical protein n=1 Tax=Streptomyces sp. Isolate_45 TaxID=2950111 RepID=UPI00248204F4